MPRFAAALLAATLVAFPAAAQQGPEEVVEGLHAVLLDSMRRADELGYQGRYEAIEPAVAERFALESMTRRATARYWGDMTEDERAALVDRFRAMTVATYAARFDGYSGQAFETDGIGEGPGGRMLVETRILRPGEEAVPLTYVLEPAEEGWRIVDIFLQGKFSEIATRRSEYTSVLKNRGYDGLVAALDGKIAEVEAGAE